MMTLRCTVCLMSIVLVLVTIPVQAATPIELGSRRELFVDHHLIEKVDGCRLELARPRDEGVVLKFDQPWEGQFCGYCTVIKDGDRFRVYYRGNPTVGRDGSNTEVTCVAESPDGIAWTKPKLGHFDVHGTKDNNVVLAGLAPFSHNFSPLLDSRPGVPADERWKAIGGTMSSGLAAFASSDGLRWRKLRDEPILTKVTVPYKYMFDSQNLAFWSESERKYVCFFRVFQDGIRRIARSTSDDFLTWSEPVLMEYRREGGSVPVEHHYTSQTHAYFRAPHIYVSLAARFMPGRQVLTDDEAKVIGVNAGYFKDTSDAIFQTSRGGGVYDRTFLEGFLRPGLGPRNWVSRTNYPALNVVQTGPDEMSFYVNQDYAQPTAHLHRYSLRLDGFASVRAGYSAGELLTKPITFTGKRLLVNLATSAAGSLRVEVQDAAGKPIPGFALDEARELIGNEIERPVSWKSGSDVSKLAGHAIRLRLVLKDADLFALRFAE